MTTVLLVVGAWLVSSVVVALLFSPALRDARSKPRRQAGTKPAPGPPLDVGSVPSPQGTGNAGLVLDRLVGHARQVLGADGIFLLAYSPGEAPPLGLVAAADPESELLGARLRTDQSAIGRAFSSGRPVVCRPGDKPGPPLPFWSGEASWTAAAPMAGRLGPRGGLLVGWNDSDAKPQLVELELLSEFAALASGALLHHEQGELMAGDSQAQIGALVGALAVADGATWRHSLEVAELATRLGARLGLDRQELFELELAALLHDIGKLRLPARILRNPGPLNAEEWELVRRHPEWGAEIVAGIPGLEAVAMLVRLHHERPDGQGYPHGLPHARIPKASRIVSVCDAYGAMVGGRPYQPRVSSAEAMEELHRHSGTQFDPEVVEMLARTLEASVSEAA